jgi:RNA polymerase sigma factor (sigma-70 family)
MTGDDWLATRFEENRDRLRSVAYRILGSELEAEDAVQETWIRLSRSDSGAIDNLGGWLTTVVGRICLDMLRTRRGRPEYTVGEHSAVLADDDVPDPELEAVQADSVGLALLVVLDTLTPAERVSFVLHDVFAVPFSDIAALLDRSEAAAQQLASRARRRVSGSPEPDRDLVRQREVVEAFFAAARDGDFEALFAVLAPDVELRVDGGTRRAESSVVLRGPAAVAGHTSTYSRLSPHVVPAFVNGAAGVVVAPGGRVFSVMAFDVTELKITRIDALVDPERLAALDLHLPGHVRS